MPFGLEAGVYGHEEHQLTEKEIAQARMLIAMLSLVERFAEIELDKEEVMGRIETSGAGRVLDEIAAEQLLEERRKARVLMGESNPPRSHAVGIALALADLCESCDVADWLDRVFPEERGVSYLLLGNDNSPNRYIKIMPGWFT